MADKPIYYGGKGSGPMYYGGRGGQLAYGGRKPMYYGGGSSRSYATSIRATPRSKCSSIPRPNA